MSALPAVTSDKDRSLSAALTGMLESHEAALSLGDQNPHVTTVRHLPATPAAHALFQFCSALYERVALIVTTNLHFADWGQIFGSERLAAALLDRLTHRAHILEFIGESYRFRERMQRETGVESDGAA